FDLGEAVGDGVEARLEPDDLAGLRRGRRRLALQLIDAGRQARRPPDHAACLAEQGQDQGERYAAIEAPAAPGFGVLHQLPPLAKRARIPRWHSRVSIRRVLAVESRPRYSASNSFALVLRSGGCGTGSASCSQSAGIWTASLP